MIALVEKKEDQEKLLQICEKTAFGCKIASVAGAYGFDKSFACFWTDQSADLAFCQSDDLMIITGTVMDPKEVGGFLQAVGPRSIMCAVRNAEALSLPLSASGDVLKKQLEPGEAKPIEPREVNIRQVYTLLEEAGMVDEFEPFYLDLSHKLRHGGALVLTEEREKELAACAVVSSISESAAILSAVVVGEKFRRQGLGSALVKQVEAYFPWKTLYVFREKEKNREFYKELGFQKADTWVTSQLV